MKKNLTAEGKKSQQKTAAYDPNFFDLNDERFKSIGETLRSRKKDKVLNIRINSEDLEKLKARAVLLGVKYQSFIAEILHQVASASIQR